MEPRRKAAQASRCQHTVTRDEDDERIFRKCLSCAPEAVVIHLQGQGFICFRLPIGDFCRFFPDVLLVRSAKDKMNRKLTKINSLTFEILIEEFVFVLKSRFVCSG